jgi:pSer/pThr/pTyr-binding forkhead associated (FHA) protein
MDNQIKAELVMVEGPAAGTRYTLDNFPGTIGRTEPAAIVIDDPRVSRRHARLTAGQHGIFVEDLNSTNGVFINGRKISALCLLRSGDEIRLGTSISFRFELVGNAAAPMPSLVVSLANGTTSTYPLDAPEITIGRADDNDIVIQSPIVSRRHLRLLRSEKDYLIQISSSATNSTLLTGAAISNQQPLCNGDEIVIGPDSHEHTVILRYEAPPASLPGQSATTSPVIIVSSSVTSRLTKADIDTILSQKNLLVRNLQITQGYHEVAHMLGHFLGFDHVNWFAFGTYASKTAGRAIRHESLPGPLKSMLVRSAGFENTHFYLNHVLASSETGSRAGNRITKILEQVSLMLSEGNLLIFSELAPPFVSLVNRFGDQRRPDEAQFNQFLDEHFSPSSFTEGGQAWLRESITAFYQARFTEPGKSKAELIFLGNILLALHEQSRLQPLIEKALAVPFDVFIEGLITEIEKDTRGLKSKLASRSVNTTRELVLRSVTRMWMSYTLPHRQMKLGQNVVAPTGLINFPLDLLIIEHTRCREIIQHFDVGLETLSGSAAGNWGSLKDRMQFIIAFFRSYQSEKRLFLPPFLEDQTGALKEGHFPGGKL